MLINEIQNSWHGLDHISPAVDDARQESRKLSSVMWSQSSCSLRMDMGQPVAVVLWSYESPHVDPCPTSLPEKDQSGHSNSTQQLKHTSAFELFQAPVNPAAHMSLCRNPNMKPNSPKAEYPVLAIQGVLAMAHVCNRQCGGE